MTPRFRCSEAAAAQPMAGTAAREAFFLLVEHPGPWGRVALDESRWLPDSVRSALADRAAAAGVRVQLIRRYGAADRASGSPAFRVFLASSEPGNPWLVTGVLHDPMELLDLSLAGLDSGPPDGLDPHDEALLLVCTNGRRDLCCAELGRPVAAELNQAFPDQTWETTHLGGHRFASAMLVLPGAFSYGRVTPESALLIGEASARGALVPELLRGRAAYSPAAQAAEVALLQRHGLDRGDALMLRSEQRDGMRTRVTFGYAGSDLVVEVEETPEPAQRQSCADEKLKPSSSWRVC